MSTKVKPLPCPLCGEEPEKPERLYATGWVMSCEQGDHEVRAWGNTCAKAIAEWNKRAVEEKEGAE